MRDLTKLTAENKARRERLVENSLKFEVERYGLNVDVQYLTHILAGTTRQLFTTVNLPEFAKINIGEGGYAPMMIKNVSVGSSTGFKAGWMDTGADNANLSKIKPVLGTQVFPNSRWAKAFSYDIPSLESADLANVNLIEEGEYYRKKEWDLGIQEIFFCGDESQGLVGLLNDPRVVVNTELMGTNATIGGMNAADFNPFAGNLMAAYRQQNNYTVLPNRFVMPEDDYNTLASQQSEQFPILTKLTALENAFKTTSRRSDFKILPTPYAIKGFSTLTKSRYAMYDESDPRSIEFSIPVDYTNTLFNSINNFVFESVAYGLISGMHFYRPQTALYLESKVA